MSEINKKYFIFIKIVSLVCKIFGKYIEVLENLKQVE